MQIKICINKQNMTWFDSLITFRHEMTTKKWQCILFTNTVNLIIRVILYCSFHKMLRLFLKVKDEICGKVKIYIKFIVPKQKMWSWLYFTWMYKIIGGYLRVLFRNTRINYWIKFLFVGFRISWRRYIVETNKAWLKGSFTHPFVFTL